MIGQEVFGTEFEEFGIFCLFVTNRIHAIKAGKQQKRSLRMPFKKDRL